MSCLARLCLFFFQAEDGIRDDLVTGVQTCALPILTASITRQGFCHAGFCQAGLLIRRPRGRGDPYRGIDRWSRMVDALRQTKAFGYEIGRASCRERV